LRQALNQMVDRCGRVCWASRSTWPATRPARPSALGGPG